MDSTSNGSITVRIPAQLLHRTGGLQRVTVSAATVREMIDALERDYPGLRFNICHETGELRRYVNVFLGTEDVRYLKGVDTPVPPGATVYIFHSVAGG